MNKSTSLNKRIPELLGMNAAIVFDIDGLKDSIEVELLIIHVATELGVINPAVPVGIADLEEILGILVMGGYVERGQSSLDLRIVQVSLIGSVEEIEEASDSEIPFVHGLLQCEEDVIHGYGSSSGFLHGIVVGVATTDFRVHLRKPHVLYGPGHVPLKRRPRSEEGVNLPPFVIKPQTYYGRERWPAFYFSSGQHKEIRRKIFLA